MKSVQKLSYILYHAGVLNTATDLSFKKKYFVFVVVVGNNTSEHRANNQVDLRSCIKR